MTATRPTQPTWRAAVRNWRLWALVEVCLLVAAVAALMGYD